MSAVSIRNLDVIFGDQVAQSLPLLDAGCSRQQIIEQTGAVVGVKNASIDVQQGEICVLMGLSGSGKSSLLRAVNGLNPISRGELWVRDDEQMIDMAKCDPHTLRHIRSHRVSMVFQKFALMPWLTVLDNVAFGLEMQSVNKQQRQASAYEKLEMVGLEQWAHKHPHELSGGMQQRVGLARAFAMDCDILLMDEPFSALDPLIRSQLQDELIELQQSLDKTILFVSHDLDEALKIGSHIAIMESAEIIQHGKPEQIVLNPSNAYVADFVAHTNPLNVLRGRSLMTPVEQLGNNEQLYLDRHQQLSVQLNLQGKAISAQRHQHALMMHHWREGDDISTLPSDSLIMADAGISMRHAIELRYHTGLPILLHEFDKLVGILSDEDFYHALLGKHFTQAAA